MLSYWEVKPHLVNNVRILNEEGIPIPPKWRKELLALSGEEHLCAELRLLLGAGHPGKRTAANRIPLYKTGGRL